MQNIVRERFLPNSNTVQDELHSGKDTDHSSENTLLLSDTAFFWSLLQHLP